MLKWKAVIGGKNIERNGAFLKKKLKVKYLNIQYFVLNIKKKRPVLLQVFKLTSVFFVGSKYLGFPFYERLRSCSDVFK